MHAPPAVPERIAHAARDVPTEQALGSAFVAAVVAGDFDAVESMFAPSVRFRAIIPRAVREAASASDARATIEGWFVDTEARELLSSAVDVVVDRLLIGYRIRLREEGTIRVTEQHVVAIVADGMFEDVAILCSGFRPVDEPVPEGTPSTGGRPAPVQAEGRLDALGLSCATLTPSIRQHVMALEPGQVLEILSDDPSAEQGLRSWTALTGHELVGAVRGSGDANRFYVRRSSRARRPSEAIGGTN